MVSQDLRVLGETRVSQVYQEEPESQDFQDILAVREETANQDPWVPQDNSSRVNQGTKEFLVWMVTLEVLDSMGPPEPPGRGENQVLMCLDPLVWTGDRESTENLAFLEYPETWVTWVSRAAQGLTMDDQAMWVCLGYRVSLGTMDLQGSMDSWHQMGLKVKEETIVGFVPLPKTDSVETRGLTATPVYLGWVDSPDPQDPLDPRDDQVYPDCQGRQGIQVPWVEMDPLAFRDKRASWVIS